MDTLAKLRQLEAENARLRSLVDALKASHAELQQAFDYAATYRPVVVAPASTQTH